MKKKLFSILLSFMMVFTMMPMMAFESFAANTRTTVLDCSTLANDDGTLATDGYHWNNVDNELSLSNITIDLSGTPETVASGESAYAIKVPDGTTINVSGNNTIIAPDATGNANDLVKSVGIAAMGSLTITGSGTLNITSGTGIETYGIRHTQDVNDNVSLKIESVTLKIETKPAYQSMGIDYSTCHKGMEICDDAHVDVNIPDTILKANNSNFPNRDIRGIDAGFSIAISRSHVTVHTGDSYNGSNSGIDTNHMSIKNDSFVSSDAGFASGDNQGSFSTLVDAGICGNDSFEISGKNTVVKTYAAGTHNEKSGSETWLFSCAPSGAGSDYNIYGGDITVSSGPTKGKSTTYNLGIFGGYVNIYGGNITATPNSTSSNAVAASVGIVGYKHLSILGGSQTVKQIDDETNLDTFRLVGSYSGYPLGVSYITIGSEGAPGSLSNALLHTDASTTQPIATAKGLLSTGFPVIEASNREQTCNIRFSDEDYVCENTTLGTKYTTLAGAIGDAYDDQPNTPETIKLLKDIEGETFYNITNGKNIILDMNGHKIDRGLTEETKNGYIFNIEQGGKLSIKNGKSDCSITGAYNSNWNSDVKAGAIQNKGTLMLENVAITNNHGQYGGGILNLGEVHLNGQTVIKENHSIADNGSTNNLATSVGGIIVDSALTNSNIYFELIEGAFPYVAIEGKVTNGYPTYNNIADAFTLFTYDGSSYCPIIGNGNEIYVGTPQAGHSIIKTLPGTGGSISVISSDGTTVVTSAASDDALTIIVTPDSSHRYKEGSLKYEVLGGGTDVINTTSLGDGRYKNADNFLMANNEITFTAEFEPIACSIGSTQYTSLASACAACTDGQESTITLLNDNVLEEVFSIPSGKKIILNLNGKTLSASDNAEISLIEISSGATLTIKDESLGQNGKITGAKKGAIRNFGTLTFASGIIDNCQSLYSGGAAIFNDHGTLNLTGGTIQNCTSLFYGGAINNTLGTVVIDGTTIRNCSTTSLIASDGGGINNNGTLTIKSGTISNCTAYSNKGNAICNANNSAPYGSLKIEGGTISVASASDNAIFNQGNSLTMTGGKVYGLIKSANTSTPISISGGIFSQKIDSVASAEASTNSFVASGYELVENTDTTTNVKYPWKVTVETPSAEPSPTPSTNTEEYKVPVEGKDTIQVEATISNGKATVKELSKETLNQVAGKSSVETVTIDLSKATQTVTGVSLTKNSVAALAEVVASKDNSFETATIKLSDSTIELDAKALEAVQEEAKGSTITLVVGNTTEGQLNGNQKETLSGYNVNKTFEAYFESNGERIHDFNGGSAVVSIKFTPEKGKSTKNYKVYYVDENGKLQKFATKYENGMIKFTTTHFSDYAIVYTASKEVLLLSAKTSGSKAIKLSWNDLDNSNKYVIYAARCGNDYKKLKTVSGTTYTLKTIKGKKLAAHKTYKFYVVSYDAIGNKVQSRSIHFITANTDKNYGNVKSIKAKYDEMLLSVGVTQKVSATYKIYGGKKHLPKSHGTALTYKSDCPEVATVNSKGKVTAKKAGAATIYIQDIGGKYCKTKVTVE